MSPELFNSGLDFGVNLLGSAIQYQFGEMAADSQLNRQKDLFDFQSRYNLPSAQMERLISAGVTPAAAAQSVAGLQQNQSVPSVSPRPSFSGLDKLGDSVMDSKLKTSEILGNSANTANTLIFGNYIDPIYRARIDNIIKDTELKGSTIGLNGQLKRVYNQTANQIKEQRPWQLSSMILGLSNLAAMINERIANKEKLNQETKTSAALEGLYKEQQNTEKTIQGLNVEKAETERHLQSNLDSSTALNYSTSLNEDLRGFELQYNNTLLSMGWNPSYKPNQNLFNLAFTNPRGFKAVVDNLAVTAQKGDDFLQSQLGKNYKKKIKRLAGAGLMYYAGNKFLDNQFRRLNSFTGAIGNLIPLAHPSQSQPSGYGYSVSF